jgi:hypothetical protein
LVLSENNHVQINAPHGIAPATACGVIVSNS